MKKIIILTVILIFSLNVFSKTKTGIYISIYNSVKSFKFMENESIELKEKYSLDNFNLFLSIFKENIFEVNLNLSTEKYINYETSNEIKRYGIGFEVGKLIGTELVRKNETILSPDFAFGAYLKFDPFEKNCTESNDSEKKCGLHFSYGLYISVKIKINIIRRLIKINSLDIGYKYLIPLYTNYKYENFKIINYKHCLYLGISF